MIRILLVDDQPGGDQTTGDYQPRDGGGDAEADRQAREAGAAAFVEKQGGAAALLDEIRRVACGGVDRETD